MYHRPPIYAVSHIVTGLLAVWYPIIGILAIVYQLGQFALNIRVFPIQGTYRRGNSVKHTAVKLAEIGLGYILGLGLYSYQVSEKN